MKLILCISFILSLSFNAMNQEDPVKWTTKSTKAGDGSYTVELSAHVENNWYVYGMNMDENGPLPLLISFEDPEKNIISYDVQEISSPKIIYDEVFGMNVASHSGKADFKLIFKPKKDIKTINIIIDGQACNTTNGICVVVYESIPIEINN